MVTKWCGERTLVGSNERFSEALTVICLADEMEHGRWCGAMGAARCRHIG